MVVEVTIFQTNSENILLVLYKDLGFLKVSGTQLHLDFQEFYNTIAIDEQHWIFFLFWLLQSKSRINIKGDARNPCWHAKCARYTSGTHQKSINSHIYVGHRSVLPVSKDVLVGVLAYWKVFYSQIQTTRLWWRKPFFCREEMVVIYFECIYPLNVNLNVNTLITCDKMEAFTEWFLLLPSEWWEFCVRVYELNSGGKEMSVGWSSHFTPLWSSALCV